MRFKPAVLAVLSLFILGCSAPSPSAHYADARNGVKLLRNPMGAGSGVVLAPGVVLTAAHVAEEPALVTRAGGTVGKVRAIGNQGAVDLAVMEYPVADAPCPCAKIADHEAEVDEPVIIVGHPYGMGPVVITSGLAQGIADAPVEGQMGEQIIVRRLVIAAGSSPGNSGGAVYAYRDGEWQLVGILVAGDKNLSMAVTLTDIRKFLEQNHINV